MIKSLKERKKERKESYKAPKKSQDIIPCSRIFENGMCLVGSKNYTMTFEFTDINYAIADNNSKDDMLMEYASILGSLDQRALWKITVMACGRSENDINRNMLMPYQDDNLQVYREEINDILKDKISKSSPYEIRRFFTCSIIKNSYEEAKDFFDRTASDLSSLFYNMGSGSYCHPLNEVERLKLLHDFYRPDEVDQWNYDGTQRTKFGDSFKTYVAPYSFVPQFDHFQMGEKFGQGMVLLEYPNGLDDDFIRSLINLKIPFVFSIDVNPVTKDEAIKYVESKSMDVESQVFKFQQRQNKHHNFNAEVPFERKQERSSLAEIYDDINNRDQHLFFCSAALVHIANDLKQLKYNSEKIISAAQNKNITFAVAKIQTRQINCLNTVLPYGVSLMDGSLRPLTSESLAAFVPFVAEECCHPNGIYCGTNIISGNIIKVDRRELMNGNCWILAVSGSGKSMFIKIQLSLLKLLPGNDSDVIIIDPENEYGTITKELCGNVVKLSPSSNTHINPFDINAEYGKDPEGSGDPVKEKSSFILSMCEQLLGDEGISLYEKSLIDRAVIKIYEPLRKTNFEGDMPTFRDFVNTLKSMEEREAKILAGKFEIYSEGSLNYFASKTNVDTESSLLCYNINEMGSQLMNLGLLIVLDNIFNRISRNRYNGRYTYVIIDEIYLLFDHEYSCAFLEKLWKRIRKYNGYATGIIQNVDAVIRNPKAKDMLSNSAFTIMLSQSDPDAAILSELYKISREEQRYIKQKEPGKGLIHLGTSTIVPFDITIPKGTKLYKLMTTKPDEVNQNG